MTETKIIVISFESLEDELAERLVNFIEDFDFFSFQDNLEIGESKEDVIGKVKEQLHDPDERTGIVEYLKDALIEDPDYESEINELLSMISEYEELEKD